jgi:hypothetical protein
MRSCLDALIDDPVFRGEDGARLAAPQTSTRSPGPSAPCAKRYVRRSRAAPIACQRTADPCLEAALARTSARFHALLLAA